MPKTDSKRVMEQRKENYDQVSFLIEAGGRKLIRALALREGCSGSELIRRSILARAGLRMLPYPDDLDSLDSVQGKEDAVSAVHRLQNRETASDVMEHLADALGAERSESRYTASMTHADIAELRNAFQKIEQAIQKEHPADDVFAPPVTITLTGLEIGTLRRMLSNIELVEDTK